MLRSPWIGLLVAAIHFAAHAPLRVQCVPQWMEYTWDADLSPLFTMTDKQYIIGSEHYSRGLYAPDNLYAHWLGPLWSRLAQLAFYSGAVLEPPAVRGDQESFMLWVDTCPIPAWMVGGSELNCSMPFAMDMLDHQIWGVARGDRNIRIPEPTAMQLAVGFTEHTAALTCSKWLPTIGSFSDVGNLRFKALYPSFLRTNPTPENGLSAVVQLLVYMNFTVSDAIVCASSGGFETETWLKNIGAAFGVGISTYYVPPIGTMWFPPSWPFNETLTDHERLIARGNLPATVRVDDPTGLPTTVRSWNTLAEDMLQANAHAHIIEMDTGCPARDVMHFLSWKGLMGSGHVWLGQDADINSYDYDRNGVDVLTGSDVPGLMVQSQGHLHYLINRIPLYQGAKSPYMYEKPFDGYFWYTPVSGKAEILGGLLEWIATLQADKDTYFGAQVAAELTEPFWSNIFASPFFSLVTYGFDAHWALELGLNSVVTKYGHNAFSRQQLLEEIWGVDFEGITGRVRFDHNGNRILLFNIQNYRIPREAPPCTVPSVGACYPPSSSSDSASVAAYMQCIQGLRLDMAPALISEATGGMFENCSMAVAGAMSNGLNCTTYIFDMAPLNGQSLGEVCASHCGSTVLGAPWHQAEDDIFRYNRCTALYCKDAEPEFLWNMSSGVITDCSALLALFNCSDDVTVLMARLQPGYKVEDVCGASCPCRAVPYSGQEVTVGNFDTVLTVTGELTFYNGSTEVPSNFDKLCPKGQKYVRQSGQCLDCEPGYFTGKAGQTVCDICPRGTANGMPRASACETCNVRTYSAEEGSLVCATCEPGYFGSQIQASYCETCDPGYFSLAGAEFCDECPIGRYSSGRGSSECLMCPNGTTSVSTGLTSAGSCFCQPGTYKNPENSPDEPTCLDCPAGMITLPGAIMQTQCYCGEGFYKDAYPNNLTCHDCPDSMICAVRSDMAFYYNFLSTGASEDPIDALEGSVVRTTFPRLEPQRWSDPKEPLSVFNCGTLDACPGNVPGTCNDLLEGRACANCPSGFERNPRGTRCIDCTTFEETPVLFPVIPVIIAPFFICFMYFMFRDMPMSWGSWQNGVSCIFFLVISHYQVLTLVLTAPVEFPQVVHEIWSIWKWTDDVTSQLKITCTGFRTVQAGMLVRAFVPLALGMIFVLTHYASQLSHHCRDGMRMDRDRTFNIYMSLFFTFFNGIAAMSMVLFKCVDNPNGVKTLHTHRGTLCYEGEWMGLLIIAVPCVLLYCIASTALFIHIMLKAPHNFGDIGFQKRWKFLFIKFRPDIYWWSTVILLKGVLLNLAFVILSDGILHLTWLLHICMFYLCLVVYFRPWRHAASNGFDVISHTVHISCIYFVAMWADSTSSLDLQLLRMCVAVSFLPLAVALMLCWSVFRKHQLPKLNANVEEEEEGGSKRSLVRSMTQHQVETVLRCGKEMAKLSEQDVDQLFMHASDYDRMCVLHCAKVVNGEFGISITRRQSTLSNVSGGRVALSRAQRENSRHGTGEFSANLGISSQNDAASNGSSSEAVTPRQRQVGKEGSLPSKQPSLIDPADKRDKSTPATPVKNGNGNGNGNGNHSGIDRNGHDWPIPVDFLDGEQCSMPHFSPPLMTPRWNTTPPTSAREETQDRKQAVL